MARGESEEYVLTAILEKQMKIKSYFYLVDVAYQMHYFFVNLNALD